MFSKKQKNACCFLFIFLMFVSFSIFAATRVFTTPYYKIELENSMQQIKNYNNVNIAAYVYGGIYKDTEASLTIYAVSPPPKEMENLERVQRQFIAGMINGLERKFGSTSTDKFAAYDQASTTHLKNKEFKHSTYKLKNGIIEIFTTVSQDKLYGFVISCYGKDSKVLNEITQSLIKQIAQTRFVY